MFVPSFLEVTISRSSGGYSGWVSLKDSHKKKKYKKKLLKIFFHVASVLGNFIDLSKTIHTVT